MVFDGRYNLIHAEGGFRPMIFDLDNDPDEFHDLAKGDSHQREIHRLYGFLAQWGRRMSQRVTVSRAELEAMRGRPARRGVLPGMKDGTEVRPEFTAAYRRPVKRRFVASGEKEES